MPDLNDLYGRHQISLYMSKNSASERLRLEHRVLAKGYQQRIADVKAANRLAAK